MEKNRRTLSAYSLCLALAVGLLQTASYAYGAQDLASTQRLAE